MSQGRRSPFTSKKRSRFLEVVSAGGSVEAAARAVGCTRRSAYHWRDRDETFRDEWNTAVEASSDRLEQTLYKLARDGDVTALIFMLRSRKPEIYNPTLLLKRQMLQLALEKARAENGLTINASQVQVMIYPVEARPGQAPLEVPRLLSDERPVQSGPVDPEDDADPKDDEESDTEPREPAAGEPPPRKQYVF